MFGTIRRHSKWLWGVIVTATIVSFVIYFGPSSRMGGGQAPKYNFGSIDGQPITREEYSSAVRSEYLEYFFSRGQWPDRDPAAKQGGFNEEAQAYQRLLLLRKAHALGISVSPETAAKVASEAMRNMGASSAREFEQRVLAGYASLDDFGRFIAQFITIQQLAGVVGLPGTLVTPKEANALWRYENQEISADLIYIPASNYVASVTASPEALRQFFTNQNERYRIPAKVAVNYVEFPVTNFWPLASQMFTNSITNVNEWASGVYEQRGSNAFGGKTLAQATDDIVAEAKRGLARRAATTNALALQVQITDTEKFTAESLPQAAKASGLTPKVSPPVDSQRPNPFLPSPVVQKAFTLTPESPISEPVFADETVYLISVATNVASYIPAFETVSNGVYADYVAMNSRQLALAAGEALHTKVVAALEKGEKFGAVCTANQVRPLPLPPFSRTTRGLPDLPAQVPIGLLQEAAFKVPVGKVSNFVPTTGGGFMVYVKEQLPCDEKKALEEVPRMMTQLRQSSQNEVFNAWRRKQSETGLRDTPVTQRANPSMGPRASR